MPRTSVSISTDLRERMDAVEEDVNWSQVAAEAFERKLAEIARRRTDRTWDRVVARLRASKLAWESDHFRQGREAGIEWAKFEAEWIQLINLGEATLDQEGDIWEATMEGPDDLADAYLLHIDERAFGELDTRAEFWSRVGAEDRPTLEFLRGFTDGALEVLDEASARMEGSLPDTLDPRRNGHSLS